ncbi:MAG: hypothetical protein ACOVO7_07075, partial [Microcystis aeruginosa]
SSTERFPGWDIIPTQVPNGNEAFRWTQSTGMVGIGDISGGSFETWATGVSADGSVIVVNGGALGNPDRIFRWTQSTGIISLGFRSSEAFDVSDDGSVIVGRAFTNNTNQAFRWTQSGTIIIGDLPGGGVVPFSSANAVS